jgi:hypothetical protein
MPNPSSCPHFLHIPLPERPVGAVSVYNGHSIVLLTHTGSLETNGKFLKRLSVKWHHMLSLRNSVFCSFVTHSWWIGFNCNALEGIHKNTATENVLPCSLIELYQHFRIMHCLHLQGRRIYQACTKQRLLTFSPERWRQYIPIEYEYTSMSSPGRYSIHSHCHENLISHIWEIAVMFWSCNTLDKKK